jgi:hypothetical protein
MLVDHVLVFSLQTSTLEYLSLTLLYASFERFEASFAKIFFVASWSDETLPFSLSNKLLNNITVGFVLRDQVNILVHFASLD